jgi:bacillithiol system protein YtxJ
MLRDRIVNLTSPEEVEAFLSQHPTSVIFKAGTCHKTMQGFGFLQEKLEPRGDLMVGLIRVIEARAASNLVAEKTGIRHESPQVILFKDGEAVFDVDNWNITPEVLGEGFEQLPAPEGKAAAPAARSDLTPYLQLLEQYLTGVLSDQQFEYLYTTTFRDDASLRSREEVEVLNSIFGDVDQHVTMHVMMAGATTDYGAVRQRAEAAYRRLKARAEAGQPVS